MMDWNDKKKVNAWIREQFDWAKENGRKLDACKGPHDFEPTTPQRLAARYRCTLCGGETDHHGERWYRIGLQHGRVK